MFSFKHSFNRRKVFQLLHITMLNSGFPKNSLHKTRPGFCCYSMSNAPFPCLHTRILCACYRSWFSPIFLFMHLEVNLGLSLWVALLWKITTFYSLLKVRGKRSMHASRFILILNTEEYQYKFLPGFPYSLGQELFSGVGWVCYIESQHTTVTQ